MIINSPNDRIVSSLQGKCYTCVVTGAAGFIGSHIIEKLLLHDQNVIGVDCVNSTSMMHEVEKNIGKDKMRHFMSVKANLVDLEKCHQIFHQPVDFVLHQAADASVSNSIHNPHKTYQDNVMVHLNMLIAAKDAKVKRFIYASSSAVYGDCPDMPCLESHIGKSLSPYATSKYINEINADLFHRLYGLESIGLRYFNVYGPRQCMNGSIMAVIPAWIQAFVTGTQIGLNGDGEQTRDFCYVEDVVQANLLAAFCNFPSQVPPIFNVGSERETSLQDLLHLIEKLAKMNGLYAQIHIHKKDYLKGDIVQSYGSSNRAKKHLHFKPFYTLEEGLNLTFQWFLNRHILLKTT